MNVNQHMIREVCIGLAAGSIAAGATYFVTKKRFAKLADQEIESVKETFKARYKRDEYETPEKAFEHLRKLEDTKSAIEEEQDKFEKIVEQSNYRPTPEDLEDNGMTGDNRPERVEGAKVGHYTVPTEASITPADEDDLPILDEPDDDRPYLIRIDQWGEEYDKHAKSSIVYYAGDKVLADETEDQIPDVERVVGLSSLTRFGEGSQDEDIVYVRNHRLKTDYEIVRDPRTFSEAVYGVDPQHIGMVERFGEHE